MPLFWIWLVTTFSGVAHSPSFITPPDLADTSIIVCLEAYFGSWFGSGLPCCGQFLRLQCNTRTGGTLGRRFRRYSRSLTRCSKTVTSSYSALRPCEAAG